VISLWTGAEGDSSLLAGCPPPLTPTRSPSHPSWSLTISTLKCSFSELSLLLSTPHILRKKSRFFFFRCWFFLTITLIIWLTWLKTPPIFSSMFFPFTWQWRRCPFECCIRKARRPSADESGSRAPSPPPNISEKYHRWACRGHDTLFFLTRPARVHMIPPTVRFPSPHVWERIQRTPLGKPCPGPDVVANKVYPFPLLGFTPQSSSGSLPPPPPPPPKKTCLNWETLPFPPPHSFFPPADIFKKYRHSPPNGRRNVPLFLQCALAADLSHPSHHNFLFSPPNILQQFNVHSLTFLSHAWTIKNAYPPLNFFQSPLDTVRQQPLIYPPAFQLLLPTTSHLPKCSRVG